MMVQIKNTKGFTLIELLIAVVIFGAVISGIVASRIRQQDQGITQQQAVEMQQNVRAVIYLMSRELRMAGFNPHYQKYDTGVTVASPNTLSFTLVASDDGDNNDGDGETDEDGELETVTYAFQDSDGDGDNDITVDYNGGGAQLISENIQNLVFSYFDETGAVTADPEEVRSIQIAITATTDIGELARSATNNTRSLSTLVYLRNLGF